MKASASSHWSWSLFFFAVTVVIICTMMIPFAFGLQSITQWGGMYVDGWCGATLYDGNSGVKDWKETKYMTAGTIGTVFSVPMFSKEMCINWAHKFCGTVTSEGWTVAWVDPYYRKAYVTEPRNICNEPITDSWFDHAQ